MPITKSAKKALRQSQKKETRNKAIKREYKETVKSLRKAVAAGNLNEAKQMLPLAYKKIDKAAKKGVIHKNTAARKKSRLARSLVPTPSS